MNLINLWAVPPFMAGGHILCSEDEAFLIFSSEVWKPLLTARQQELREDLTNLFKIILSYVVVFCALCQEVLAWMPDELSHAHKLFGREVRSGVAPLGRNYLLTKICEEI